MKKFIALLLALSMLFALSACSLDSLVTGAENKVVKLFKVNASGDPDANRAAFAANACLVLLDAGSAAEQLRAYFSCAGGYLDAAEVLDESTSPADTLELVKQAYNANEGRSYDSMCSSLSAVRIGCDNLKLTLPENDTVCSDFLAAIESLAELLKSAGELTDSITESSVSQAAQLLSSFDAQSNGLYESISQYRLNR